MPGGMADFVLLNADPTTSASVLAHPEEHVRLVIKEGLVAAAPGGEAVFGAVNAKLGATHAAFVPGPPRRR